MSIASAPVPSHEPARTPDPIGSLIRRARSLAYRLRHADLEAARAHGDLYRLVAAHITTLPDDPDVHRAQLPDGTVTLHATYGAAHDAVLMAAGLQPLYGRYGRGFDPAPDHDHDPQDPTQDHRDDPRSDV